MNELKKGDVLGMSAVIGVVLIMFGTLVIFTKE